MMMHHFELGPDGGDPEQFVRAMERATGNATDPKAIIERVAGNLGEGLDMENIPDSCEFTDGAHLNMRIAVFFGWTGLPKARRTRPEAERIVRLSVSRLFALIEDVQQELSGT